MKYIFIFLVGFSFYASNYSEVIDENIFYSLLIISLLLIIRKFEKENNR